MLADCCLMASVVECCTLRSKPMKIISHGQALPSDLNYSKNAQEIRERLNSFELGRFLLNNLGLNGYWTSYVLLHPDRRQLNCAKPLCEL